MQRVVRKAVIDIDNTLWHFCDLLYERLRMINKVMPPPEQWAEWDFWEGYCSLKEFMEAINDIHLNQDEERHRPYPEAKGFLSALREHGFSIVLASHRIPESRKQTERWLGKHDLIYDELHLSFNKTVLFDDHCRIVVDDAPHVLEKAREKGARSAGLLFPWNRVCLSSGFNLFRNLNEALHYLLER